MKKKNKKNNNKKQPVLIPSISILLVLPGASKALLLTTHTHTTSTPFSATHLVSHLPSKKNTTVTNGKTKKNNALSIASNKIILKKDLKENQTFQTIKCNDKSTKINR